MSTSNPDSTMSNSDDPENTENQSQRSVEFRTRRRHCKSRNGCAECKRRKVKCDEAKPSCSRCTLGMQKCIYSSEPSTENSHANTLSLPSPPGSILLSPSRTPSNTGKSPSSKASPASTATGNSKFCIDSANISPPLSNTDLYHHYLQHTSRTLTHCQRDQGAIQIGMPTLALQSKSVFHSILALSAVCICCDMISESAPDLGTVMQILTTAYEHYNLASEKMRNLMSGPDTTKPDTILASSILLVPFTTASQQVSHWISTHSETKEKYIKFLTSTPKDVIVIMRGLRTTLQALAPENFNPHTHPSGDEDSTSLDSLWPAEFGTPLRFPPSRVHVMFPVLTATIQGAFCKLQERQSYAPPCHGGSHDASLSACSAAFDYLNMIRTNTFSPDESASYPSSSSTAESLFDPEELALPQVAPWLSSYASRPVTPRSTDPLTKFFLTFLVQVPQEYLDLVLPLLDQRLETPLDRSTRSNLPELTREQALALDIYAHWSVLMLLVEEESWWIGKLPVITLTGMLNRYGDDFVTRACPECGDEMWWPSTMLHILREIKRCQ